MERAGFGVISQLSVLVSFCCCFFFFSFFFIKPFTVMGWMDGPDLLMRKTQVKSEKRWEEFFDQGDSSLNLKHYYYPHSPTSHPIIPSP